MRPFLRGFSDELLKVATSYTSSSSGLAAAPKPVAPPSTGVRGAPSPQPANAFGPSNAFSQAIPTQRMESPAKPSQPTWRPSPGARINTAQTAPAPTAPKASGGSRRSGPSADPGVPWESGSQMIGRGVREFISRAQGQSARNQAGSQMARSAAGAVGGFAGPATAATAGKGVGAAQSGQYGTKARGHSPAGSGGRSLAPREPSKATVAGSAAPTPAPQMARKARAT